VSSNESRAATLVRALRAGVEGDRQTLAELFTDDARAWTPALSAASLQELLDELERRDEAFSDVELDAAPLDVGGAYACVEWTVAMTHTGPISLPEGATIEPSGVRVTVHGVTVGEFLDDRICALRQYWDAFSVLEQLGVTAGVD